MEDRSWKVELNKKSFFEKKEGVYFFSVNRKGQVILFIEKG
ncbi:MULTISPECIES: hypothetical protein [unclassified Bacillus (in: firmicutes)]|nr:hypothetical protein [Bacillus sp. 196mf]MED3310039.1 hypothetical protein [Bacillus thuringiensis]